jgi:acetyl-CoA carboxylase beta subunit
MKIFDSDGMRLTDCCGCHSNFYHDEVEGPQLVCKKCYELVEIGEGDGEEYEEALT